MRGPHLFVPENIILWGKKSTYSSRKKRECPLSDYRGGKEKE